jgi:CAAX prenyl protease-like protein
LLVIAITYKIAEMAVGSKTFPPIEAAGSPAGGRPFSTQIASVRSGRRVIWGEILLVFVLLELVLWTPRNWLHTVLITSMVASVLYLGFRGRSRGELGFVWPSRSGTGLILGFGCIVAVGILVGARLTGYSLPANPDWPKLRNIWPYVIWAIGQQFLLQSFFYLRFEALLGGRLAVLASTGLFVVVHLPNFPLTGMTLLGGLFFTELFRIYRSLYPLAIVHALMGIAIAYSFPDSLMHHMRVGLSFWQFR